MEFDAKIVKDRCVNWIRKWFEENGFDCNAVIGISGGKDSTIVAALCVEALGRHNVIGVLMPDGEQSDIADAYKVVDYLKIKHFEINIEKSTCGVLSEMLANSIQVSDQTKMNLPARIRMSTLYAVAQSLNGRVANTCNLSEDYLGWATRFGDQVGDFAPIAQLTVQEVKAIGRELGIPEELIEKIPSDGLCNETDEQKFGFSYRVLDKYIRTGEIEDMEIKKKIDEMHKKNLFKLLPMPTFNLEYTYTWE